MYGDETEGHEQSTNNTDKSAFNKSEKEHDCSDSCVRSRFCDLCMWGFVYTEVKMPQEGRRTPKLPAKHSTPPPSANAASGHVR